MVGDQDDESAIQLTLKKQHAILVSRDKFRDHQKKLSADEWAKLKGKIVSDFHFIDGELISPSLSDKVSQYNMQVVKTNLKSEKAAVVTTATLEQPTKAITNPLEKSDEEFDEMILLDELYAGLFTLSSDDNQFHMTELLAHLARELLGYEGLSSDFPSGWVNELKSFLCQILGGDLRPSTWIKQNLPAGFSVVGENVLLDD